MTTIVATPRLDRMKVRHGATLSDVAPVLKQSVMTNPEVDVDLRTIQGVIATACVDMDNEVVLPNFDTDYFPSKVKAVYWSHQYADLPIGKCVNLTPYRKGLYTQTYITKSGIGDDVLTLVHEGIVNGFSIGADPIDAGAPTPMERKTFGDISYIVRHSRLMEYSITPMPSNPEALIGVAKSGLVKASTVGAILGKQIEPDGKATITVKDRASDWPTAALVDETGNVWRIGVGSTV